MRSDWMDKEGFRILLTALMPENALVLETCLETGLRLGDVLALRRGDVEAAASRRNHRITVKEQKTGKNKRIYLPAALCQRLLKQAGRLYIFEHRTDENKHRNRTTVYRDLKRVAKLYRIDGKRVRGQVSPHSARKIYAVDKMRRGSTLEQLQKDFNHSSPMITSLYAFADRLTRG